MENSSPSENNSPNNYAYYRMNSEVIEKPSHFMNGSDCDEDNSLEILALLSSPDNSPPCEEVCVLDHGSQSPRSSTKGDGKES